MAELEVIGWFHYTEIIGNDSIPKRVRFPIRNFSSGPFEVRYDGERFFRSLEEQVPASTSPTKKIIEDFNNIEIEIFASIAIIGIFPLQEEIDKMA